MANTNLVTRRIKERKSVIDVSINSQIKNLQRKLVQLTFSGGNNTTEYFKTLGKIHNLRQGIVE